MDTVNPWRRKPNQENWANTTKFVRLKKKMYLKPQIERAYCVLENINIQQLTPRYSLGRWLNFIKMKCKPELYLPSIKLRKDM